MYRARSCHPPRWLECSDRREPESLNVQWMAMNIQYSASYMSTCFYFFEPNVVGFFFSSFASILVTRDVSEIVCVQALMGKR